MPKPSAQSRATAHFFEALERASSLDAAWRVVLSAPKPPQPGVELYSRLSLFLKTLEPSRSASQAEREAYLALVRRFLSTGAMEKAAALRAIDALRGPPKQS